MLLSFPSACQLLTNNPINPVSQETTLLHWSTVDGFFSPPQPPLMCPIVLLLPRHSRPPLSQFVRDRGNARSSSERRCFLNRQPRFVLATSAWLSLTVVVFVVVNVLLSWRSAVYCFCLLHFLFDSNLYFSFNYITGMDDHWEEVMLASRNKQYKTVDSLQGHRGKTAAYIKRCV